MARPSPATTDDLAVALGVDAVDNEDQAQFLLDRAWAIVRAYAGHPATWLDDDGNPTDQIDPDIPPVIVGMVDRATRNPTGTTQETAGPFSRSFGSDAAQRLYLTKMDKLVIRGGLGLSGLGTISTTRGDLETPSVIGCDGIDYLSDIDDITALLQ